MEKLTYGPIELDGSDLMGAIEAISQIAFADEQLEARLVRENVLPSQITYKPTYRPIIDNPTVIEDYRVSAMTLEVTLPVTAEEKSKMAKYVIPLSFGLGGIGALIGGIATSKKK